MADQQTHLPDDIYAKLFDLAESGDPRSQQVFAKLTPQELSGYNHWLDKSGMGGTPEADSYMNTSPAQAAGMAGAAALPLMGAAGAIGPMASGALNLAKGAGTMWAFDKAASAIGIPAPVRQAMELAIGLRSGGGKGKIGTKAGVAAEKEAEVLGTKTMPMTAEEYAINTGQQRLGGADNPLRQRLGPEPPPPAPKPDPSNLTRLREPSDYSQRLKRNAVGTEGKPISMSGAKQPEYAGSPSEEIAAGGAEGEAAKRVSMFGGVNMHPPGSPSRRAPLSKSDVPTFDTLKDEIANPKKKVSRRKPK